MSDSTEERLAREGDHVLFTCSNLSSAENSVVWLYTPGEAYEGVQHIYTDGRMLSRWTSRCNVTTNATASTLALHSVQPSSGGYYECSEEHFSGFDVRFRAKLMVSDMNAGRTQNVGDIIAAFNKDIVIWVSIATAVLIVCILLALFVSLKQKQKDFKGRPVLSKAMDRRTIQGEMTNCEKISSIPKFEDVATGLPLLHVLSQSVEEHHPHLPSSRMSFLNAYPNDPNLERA